MAKINAVYQEMTEKVVDGVPYEILKKEYGTMINQNMYDDMLIEALGLSLDDEEDYYQDISV